MAKELRVLLFDLVMCLSDAVDLVSPALANHHEQVAYIAFSIAKELGLSTDRQNELALAGALHDVGGFSLRERLNALYEMENPHQHAETGYVLLKEFAPFSNLAPSVRYHHVPWNEGDGSVFKGNEVPLESHILHLADRVATLLNKEHEILGQAAKIRQAVKEKSGKAFMPDLAEAFTGLAEKEYFWLDVVSPSLRSILLGMLTEHQTQLDLDELVNFAKLFAHVIDFRSQFTASHSSSVAASAELLARFAGFSERECSMMRVAGYLHDLGKLAVPKEVLEKRGKLTDNEFNTIRSHTFHTYRIFERLSDFNTINEWASFHHERLDGNGYPFHHKACDLPMGSRIMAVADVFSALMEDRPYRKGMPIDKTLQVIQELADHSALDPEIISLLRKHLDEMNSCHTAGSEREARAYQEFGAGASNER